MWRGLADAFELPRAQASGAASPPSKVLASRPTEGRGRYDPSFAWRGRLGLVRWSVRRTANHETPHRPPAHSRAMTRGSATVRMGLSHAGHPSGATGREARPREARGSRPITSGGQRATHGAYSAREQRESQRVREDGEIARLISAPPGTRWAAGAEEAPEDRVEFPPPIQRALRGEAPAEDREGEVESRALPPIHVPSTGDPARSRPQTSAPRGTPLPLSAVYHPRLRNRVRIRPARVQGAKGAAPAFPPRLPATAHGRAMHPTGPGPERKPPRSAGASSSPPRTQPSRASAAAGPASPRGDGVPAALAVQLPPAHVEVVPESQVRPVPTPPSSP